MARASSRSARIISTQPSARISPVIFLRETVSELRKSVWPSREETSRLTVVVIVSAVAAAILMGGLDRLFHQAFTAFF